MKTKILDLSIYIVFATMFLWDILDDMYSDSPYIFLIFSFVMICITKDKIVINKKIVIVGIFVLVHGIINTIYHNDDATLLITQFVSIMFCVILFYNITMKVPIYRIIKVYWLFSSIMATIGLIEEVIAVFHMGALANLPLLFIYTKYNYSVLWFVKLAAFCREPSFLGYFLAPAFCIALFNFISKEKMPDKNDFKVSNLSCILIIAAYLFTFSLTAYFGLLLCLLFIWFGKKFSLKKIMVLAFGIAIASALYISVPDINIRVNDTIDVFFSDNVTNTNLSSDAFYSNYNVTKQAFNKSSFLGFGLGSYQISYDKYNISNSLGSVLMLNRKDANSMLFRITAELGIVGIIFIVWFIFKFFVTLKSEYYCISCSILILILMLLLRQGNYTHGGILVFWCMYHRIFEISKYENKRKGECISSTEFK